MKRSILISGIASLLIIFVAFTGHYFLSAANTTIPANKARETSSNKKQWEYLVVAGGNVNLSSSGVNSRMSKQPPESGFPRENYPLERNLDKLGAQGWELVSVSGPPNDPIYYLKRLKEEE